MYSAIHCSSIHTQGTMQRSGNLSAALSLRLCKLPTSCATSSKVYTGLSLSGLADACQGAWPPLKNHAALPSRKLIQCEHFAQGHTCPAACE